MNLYKGYGLVFQSEIDLPEFPACTGNCTDITIAFSKVDVPPGRPAPGKNRIWAAEKNRFVLNVKGIGSFKVRNGKRILIHPHENACVDDLRFVLLGSVLAALLQQRGFLVLHAGAIQTRHGAVLFTGPSGHGKSTLTAALSRSGYPVLSDDVVAVDTSGEHPLVLPAFPRLRLWADAASTLALDLSTLKTARAGLKKYLVPVANFARETSPLHRIYTLDVHNGTTLSLSALSPTEKVAMLIDNTYRIRFLSGFGLMARHHAQITALAQDIDMRRVERPSEPLDLDRLVGRIEKDLEL